MSGRLAGVTVAAGDIFVIGTVLAAGTAVLVLIGERV
jgi:hypothetical protein